MENTYAKIDLNSYVAKYVDENGCTLEEACKELEIDSNMLFLSSKKEY